ncbi:MAG TPA: hypothetical protein VGC04_14280 [Cellulomonas sp.]
MRLYLPATLDELDGLDRPGGAAGLGPRRGHAVTVLLRAALPDEDEEGLEYAALLAAADDSLLRVAARPSAPHLRVVVSVDVPDALVAPVEEEDAAPSAVELSGALPPGAVVCAHVDEPPTARQVARALTGDESAVEALAEADLLWYDVSELGSVPR